MKILKIFGLVVGIHVFALILIFANPGCSTATKPAPVPGDTMARPTPPPAMTVPNTSASGVYTSGAETAPITAAPAVAAPGAAVAPAPVLFDPNAPAMGAAGSSPNTVRFTPTRPGSPVVAPLQAEKVADVTPATTYIVKPGDSLWSIAKKHKLTVADLTATNGLAANANLQPGKKLLIPAKSSPAVASSAAVAGAARAASATPPPRPTGEGAKHTVRSGETLGTIARNYGVRQSDIAVANGISDPAKIQAGMELIIPGAAASKSAKGGKAPAKADAKVEEPAAPPANPAPLVPIIRLDDSPVTPAPKP